MPVFFAHSLEWRPRSGLRASQRLARTKSMRSALTTSLELVPVIHPVDVEDMRLATELFRRYGPKGVTPRDAIHAAVMMNRGVKEIISTDSHFDLIEGITRLDPESLFRKKGEN